MVSKLKINYWVDVGLGITIITSGNTGLLKWPGAVRIFGLRHAVLPMYQITTIHDYSGLLMALLAIVHIVLHWNWIVCTTKSLFKKKSKNKEEDAGEKRDTD
jgi:hypothetical protein